MRAHARAHIGLTGVVVLIELMTLRRFVGLQRIDAIRAHPALIRWPANSVVMLALPALTRAPRDRTTEPTLQTLPAR